MWSVVTALGQMPRASITLPVVVQAISQLNPTILSYWRLSILGLAQPFVEKRCIIDIVRRGGTEGAQQLSRSLRSSPTGWLGRFDVEAQ